MEMQSNFIIVTLEAEGMHRWKDAPEAVNFLRNWHRHIFKVQVKLQVLHDDRELEFILVKRWLQPHLEEFLKIPGEYSCEMISEYLLRQIVAEYGGNRWIEIVTYEDGENGGGVSYAPVIL